MIFKRGDTSRFIADNFVDGDGEPLLLADHLVWFTMRGPDDAIVVEASRDFSDEESETISQPQLGLVEIELSPDHKVITVVLAPALTSQLDPTKKYSGDIQCKSLDGDIFTFGPDDNIRFVKDVTTRTTPVTA